MFAVVLGLLIKQVSVQQLLQPTILSYIAVNMLMFFDRYGAVPTGRIKEWHAVFPFSSLSLLRTQFFYAKVHISNYFQFIILGPPSTLYQFLLIYFHRGEVSLKYKFILHD